MKKYLLLGMLAGLGCSKSNDPLNELNRRNCMRINGFVISEQTLGKEYSFRMRLTDYWMRTCNAQGKLVPDVFKPSKKLEFTVIVDDWLSPKALSHCESGKRLDEELEKWTTIDVEYPYRYRPESMDSVHVKREQVLTICPVQMSQDNELQEAAKEDRRRLQSRYGKEYP